MPVWTRLTWFHLTAGIAVNWWDIPVDEMFFEDEHSRKLAQRPTWGIRAVCLTLLVFEMFCTSVEVLEPFSVVEWNRDVPWRAVTSFKLSRRGHVLLAESRLRVPVTTRTQR